MNFLLIQVPVLPLSTSAGVVNTSSLSSWVKVTIVRVDGFHFVEVFRTTSFGMESCRRVIVAFSSEDIRISWTCSSLISLCLLGCDQSLSMAVACGPVVSLRRLSVHSNVCGAGFSLAVLLVSRV